MADYKINSILDGTWEKTVSEKVEVFNPADGDFVGSVPAFGPEIAQSVFETARKGADEWALVSPLKRGEIMIKASQLMISNMDALADVIVRENGKTLAEARGEVQKSAEFLEYYGGMGRDQVGYLIADARPNTSTRVLYEPVGVVLAITPWNDALLTPCRKLAPALIAGNSVVLKPASDTPLIMIELAKILLEAGLPSEVLSIVTGRGGYVVDELLRNENIDAVTFTGSTEVGLQIQEKLAGRNIRIQTEMGGKNASVVMNDADLEAAADTVISAAFGGAGQRCTATSRILVERPVYDEFMSVLKARVEAMKVASGFEEGVQMGALINKRHRDNVVGAIEEAESAGGSILVGGKAPGGDLAAGSFVEPTIIVDVERESAVWKEEIFGPVIAVRTFDDVEVAIEEVNDSQYGLSAAIFTKSLQQAENFINKVKTGQVSVNLPTSGWDIHHPFGGYKFSGSGYKEQGTEALTFYRRVKTVAVKAW